MDVAMVKTDMLLSAAPLLTAGAATAALYDAVVRSFHRGESDYLLRFFSCFKRELKAALLPTLLCAALLYALLRLCAMALSALALSALHGAPETMAAAGLFVLLLIPIGALCWLFPLLSRFQLDLRPLLGNSLRLSLGHLPQTLIIAALACAAVCATLRFALLPVFFSRKNHPPAAAGQPWDKGRR